MPGDRRHPLIVGYGNPLRGDDGLGPAAAALLAEDPRLRGARVLARHQLTPELAADFVEAKLVILIDANVEDEAGAVSVRRLDATTGRGSGPGSSHHASPADLAALARELWGASPAVFIVTVGAASLDVGEGLSDPVRRALPAVVEAVVAIMAEHGGAGLARLTRAPRAAAGATRPAARPHGGQRTRGPGPAGRGATSRGWS